MKRLSREERVGAVVLAVITILMVAGLFMFRGCGRSADAELPKVTVITQPPIRQTLLPTVRTRKTGNIARERAGRKALPTVHHIAISRTTTPATTTPTHPATLSPNLSPLPARGNERNEPRFFEIAIVTLQHLLQRSLSFV